MKRKKGNIQAASRRRIQQAISLLSRRDVTSKVRSQALDALTPDEFAAVVKTVLRKRKK